MFRIIPFIVVVVLALALAADSVAGTPSYGDTTHAAAWSATLAPGQDARVPARTCGGRAGISDLHAYAARNGRAFTQRRDSHGIYWTSGGRVVAEVNGRTFTSHARSARIVVSVWCG